MGVRKASKNSDQVQYGVEANKRFITRKDGRVWLLPQESLDALT